MPTAVLPRGPKGNFISGNLPAFQKDWLGFVTQVAREYGDIVKLRFGPKPVVLLSHPDYVEYVLVTNNRNFTKDFTLRLYKVILGNGLLTSDGDFWLRQRRMIQPVFQKQRIASFGTTMVAFTQRMLANWQDGAVMDLHSRFMQLALEIAAKTLFDADVTAEARDVGEALETALWSINNRFNSLFWLPAWLPTPNNLQLRRAVRRLDDILYRIIDLRRKSGEDRGDLLSLLLHAKDEDDGSRMTDRQLRDEAMTLFLAGHETTALALSWTWYLLGQHPHVVAELEAELESVLGGKSPSAEDYAKLRFTEWIVMESMRLYPPAFGLGREAIQDCEIAGYHIPAGTTLFFHQWVIHRDSRFFIDPEKFLPQRWADGLAQRIPKYAYFPFGGGPRLCIGNTFAMMEAVLILATMAQKFRVQLVPDHPVEIWPTITLRPKYGIKVVLKKRCLQ
ncbi:MAG TPA: cytochrome P450 [Gemmataceae bacterium]|jgi:cytochrome P450|nr:cytochrome P450 [Gemmataceae bacterium]